MKRAQTTRSRLRSEAGQVFVLFALTLPVLLGLAAVVVDAGGLYFQKRTLRGAADAAALAAAQDLYKSSCSGGSCVAQLTGQYSGLNSGKVGTSNLTACLNKDQWNCYTYPYIGANWDQAPNSDKVEVKLRKSVPTTFARIFGISQVTVSGRAVAKVSPGEPPPYNFVALNSSTEKHTLLIKTGGNLTVDGIIYTNSADDHDGFDIFGDGGSITAPDIINHAGWETHDASFVTVTKNGNTIPCPTTGGNNQAYWPPRPGDPTGPGCPQIGQPILADPFVNLIVAPTVGPPACLGTSYNASAYTPAQTLKTAINGSVTTLRASGNAISAGDTIQIDSERMLVTGPPVPVNAVTAVTNKALAAGVATLTAPGHTIAVGASVTVAIGDARFNGTYTVSAVTASTFSYTPTPPFSLTVPTTSWTVVGKLATLTATTPPHGLVVGDTVTVSGFPAAQKFLNGNFTLTAVGSGNTTFSYQLGKDNTGNGLDDGVATWTGTDAAASGNVSYTDGVNLTVQRAYLGTTAVAHNANRAILRVTATPSGTAAAPAPCVISSGTVTLSPGTYYGGIDISGTANVTFATGVYIMAGGGLRVTDAAQLHAPDVLVYNTNDAAASPPTDSGKVGQILLNTTGAVQLGPQTTPPYQGLTIFQDPTLAVTEWKQSDPKERKCDSRPSDEWDIALLKMASTGVNGALGSISGTIYAAHPHALFGDSVSGTANLAVITGCIRIEGAKSTFKFEAGGLYGGGSSLTE